MTRHMTEDDFKRRVAALMRPRRAPAGPVNVCAPGVAARAADWPACPACGAWWSAVSDDVVQRTHWPDCPALELRGLDRATAEAVVLLKGADA